MTALLAALLPVLLNALLETPQIVAEVESIWTTATSSTAPTAEQQAAIDAALDAAHAKLQAS
jgi:hypothetical protein